MKDFLLILIGFVGFMSFTFSIIYFIGSIRTKDKNAAYISVALMIVSIISVFYLAY